ncbi:diguanylate cyclase (GGDEF)-like protein/PAS domain S-box-containing protein [Actimicrobium sp. GrIS 1.19]|uniref:bifunctional diguanylate cyclase/phosphodiesterase n=1 Tax=Actimicrobium sp. GrIS 1.19 TaxID=3071708 RepID=UPI002DF8F78E|nr:diguanylate cyclase (GGDEF)-like protein/PAS domain S-box-containing protein [Actimicrobium sp. GrIS 1.19]
MTLSDQIQPVAPAIQTGSLLRWALLTAMLYWLVASATLFVCAHDGGPVALWYANAVAAAMLLSSPVRQWPVLLLAVAAGNAAVNVGSPQSMLTTALFIPGNLLEIGLSAYLMRRYVDLGRCLTQVGMLLRGLALGGLVPALAGALAGAAVLSLQHLRPFGQVWPAWYAASALGSVAVLPLIFCLRTCGWRDLLGGALKPIVAVAMAAVVLVCLATPSGLGYPYVYILIALILVAVVGSFGATAVAVLTCSAISGTLLASGALQPQHGVGALGMLLVYLPLLLTLAPPMLLAVAFEKVLVTSREAGEREAHFRALYEQTPAMMHSLDTQGRLVSVSQSWLDRLGYRREEVLGRQSVEFMTPDSARFAREVVLPNLMSGGRTVDVAYQLVSKTGELIDVLVSAIWAHDSRGNRVRTMSVLTDVTERKRLAGERSAEQEQIRVTLHSIGDGVLSTDADGRITYLNPVAEEIVGWTLEEARGLLFSDVVYLFDQDNGARLPSPIEQCLRTQDRVGLPESASLRSRNGKEFGVRDSIAPIHDTDGVLLGAVMVFQDVTESRRHADEMSYAAHHDGLTGLPNRILFHDRLRQACQHGAHRRERFAVVFMDLDHFKHINDSLGHAMGDEVLKTVAQRLNRTLRAGDTVSRLGGDEFVMLLMGLGDGHAVDDIAQHVIDEAALPLFLNGVELNLTVSVGIAMFPDDGDDPNTLMKRADTAMYRSKREGRNRYHFFSKAVDDAAAARLQLESDIRRGINEQHFYVHYQPVLEARSHRVIGVEALARWDRNGTQPESPALFIPVAEESGLIVPLGKVILEQACHQLAAWSGTGLRHMQMAVNVSTVQLREADFVDMVSAILRESGVPGSRLKFEITESTLMTNAAAMLQVMHRIKLLGIEIAIDDFGTGYSSLSYLKRFPVDTLKIDQSFVRDMESDVNDRELIKAILAIAASLQLNVIAEGVETEGQAALLIGMGCPQLQGYLFARPADAATTTAWLLAQSRLDEPAIDLS